jgi:hypothetical protein
MACGEREAGSAGRACTAGEVRDAFGNRGGTERGGRDIEGTGATRGAGDDVCTDLTGGGIAGSCAARGGDTFSSSWGSGECGGGGAGGVAICILIDARGFVAVCSASSAGGIGSVCTACGYDDACGGGDDVCTDVTGGGVTGSCAVCGEDAISGS